MSGMSEDPDRRSKKKRKRNAHNRAWYSGFNDDRGDLILDLMNGFRYTICRVNLSHFIA